MKVRNFILVLAVCFFSSACSDWIYRIDVPQGNYLEQKDVDKLRVQMTKEQVRFVLGNPVVADSFNNEKWYYIYDMKRGMSKYGEDVRRELIIHFKDGKVTRISGTFDQPEDFNTPLDS